MRSRGKPGLARSDGSWTLGLSVAKSRDSGSGAVAACASLGTRSGCAPRPADPFWPSVLIVEQKSAGRNLGRENGQAGEYFDAVPERDRPRYVLPSDSQPYELHDLDDQETASRSLPESSREVEEFDLIPGVQRRTPDVAVGSCPRPPTGNTHRHFRVLPIPYPTEHAL